MSEIMFLVFDFLKICLFGLMGHWLPLRDLRRRKPRLASARESGTLLRVSPKKQALVEPTVDGRNLAPPKKPWNDDSPVNNYKQ